MSELAGPDASSGARERPFVVLGVAGGIAAYKAAELVRLQVLQQASAAVLAQANQSPSIVLQLLEA